MRAAPATLRTNAGALPRSDAQHVPSLFLGASWVQADGLFLS